MSRHLPLLDPEIIEDLQMLESVKPGLVNDLIRKFENARLAQMCELRIALGDGELEPAANLVHSLRGGAAALGMQRVADAFEQLESCLPDGRPRFDALLDLLHESIAALRARFANPPTTPA